MGLLHDMLEYKDNMQKVSIVIPCFNEAKTIREIIRRVEEAPLPGWEREIIVVDDCSTDGTRDLLREFEPRHTIVFREKNGGKGTALCTGFQAASGTHLLVQDADLEYDPRDMHALLAVLEGGQADVVYGSRNLSPKTRRGGLIALAGVVFITKLINMLYRLSLTDVWTCYKLFPREAAMYFTPGGFESELLFTAALARGGYRFAEVPISYNPRNVNEGKKIRYRDGFRAIGLLIADWLTHRQRIISSGGSQGAQARR